MEEDITMDVWEVRRAARGVSRKYCEEIRVRVARAIDVMMKECVVATEANRQTGRSDGGAIPVH